MKAVTYGPFPGGWPEEVESDFRQIRSLGFNAVRLYEMPDRMILDAAGSAGLKVFGGLRWALSADFFRCPGQFSAAKVALSGSLRITAGHPALAGVYVGNEVPADLARWMGPARTRRAIEELIALGKDLAPDLLFAYASYPSTEYLEPANADFTALNVYLEDEENFRSYIRRLHHVAGDRPLVISEFGLDSRRNGLGKQADVLQWAVKAALAGETAGMTVYAWSDRWWNAGAEVTDWDFGLIDRSGTPKPAMEACSGPAAMEVEADLSAVSVIVCTRDGRTRIGGCLRAIRAMSGGGWEIIVVDDGSTDGTGDFIAANFPEVNLLRLPPGGLSTARNAGAAAARGDILAFTDDDCEPDMEWIARLLPLFADGRFVAAGGPNLPPPPRTREEAVVCAAPGAPSHVMLDDVEAEHLPGCNIAVTKAAFEAIGGFDPIFHTAGDDVDFCWRLREAGYRLGFAPGAFVWHWRRPSLRTFLRQQWGYGQAERLLLDKHPHRFSNDGEARWEGFVYGGGPVRAMDDSIIYHGPMGEAGYQAVVNRMLPLRGLAVEYQSPATRSALAALRYFQVRVRAWARNRRWPLRSRPAGAKPQLAAWEEFEIASAGGLRREVFLRILIDHGWTPCGATDDWDVEKAENRALVATECGAGPGTLTLVRVQGDHREVERLLRSVSGETM